MPRREGREVETGRTAVDVIEQVIASGDADQHAALEELIRESARRHPDMDVVGFHLCTSAQGPEQEGSPERSLTHVVIIYGTKGAQESTVECSAA